MAEEWSWAQKSAAVAALMAACVGAAGLSVGDAGDPPGGATSVIATYEDVVLVRIGAALGAGMYVVQVQLSVDGSEGEDLHLGRFSGEGAPAVPLTPGTHQYELVVEWVDVQGMTHRDTDAGDLTVRRGLAYEISVDGTGSAALVAAP